jgi:hypothetical protein
VAVAIIINLCFNREQSRQQSFIILGIIVAIIAALPY